MSFNFYFPAQVINLPRRSDRREQFAAHAKEQGFAYAFRDGIEGKRGPMKDIATAHKNIVSWAKDHGLPEVLIMEDDCYFPDKDGFAWFKANQPTEPHDIYLGGIYSGAPDASGRVASFCATHCYVVQARFYDRFLCAPLDQHLDHALSSLGGDYRVCRPFAAIQRVGFSDQTGKQQDHSGHVAGRYFDGTQRMISNERWTLWQEQLAILKPGRP